MAAKYQHITPKEMEEFCKGSGFVRVHLPTDECMEIVYGRRVDTGKHPLTLRIYTGIHVDGYSREVGKDAIRVVLFMKRPDGVVVKIGGCKRVHRVKNWRVNLQDRLSNWSHLETKKECPECGLPMIPRLNKKQKNWFLGCAGYPECRKTMNVPKEFQTWEDN